MRLFVRRAVAAAAAGLALVRPLAGQQPAPAAPPAPTITLGVLAYGQYLYQLKDTLNHQNDFEDSRAYVNAIARSGTVMGRITVDLFNGGTNASRFSYRLKYAYAAWTPAKSALTYKFGLIHTAWLDWEEALWDYRMQGSMPIERNGYQSSADFGAGVDGKWTDDQVNMQVTLVNGEGYGGGVGDQRKDAQARVSVRAAKTDDASRVGGLRLTGFAQYGKPTGGGTRQRYLGMLSYRSKLVTLAGQFLATTDSTAGAPNVSGQMFSAYGVYRVPKSGAALLARVDYSKPNTNVLSTAPGVSNARVIAGVSYQITPNLRVLGDLDLLSYKNGSPNAAAEAARQTAYFQMQVNF